MSDKPSAHVDLVCRRCKKRFGAYIASITAGIQCYHCGRWLATETVEALVEMVKAKAAAKRLKQRPSPEGLHAQKRREET